MRFLITATCLSTACFMGIAAEFSFTNLNDPQSKQLFGQLVSRQEFDPNTEAQATAAAMSSLLTYMAASIKQMPGYAGYFAGNCSVFFYNVSIGQVGCNIIPVAVVSVNQTQQLNAPVQLPREYATQITQSHILLASLFADWSRKIAQKLEQFEISLFQKVETCTLSASATETKQLTPSETRIQTPTLSSSQEQTLTVSQNISNTYSDSVSFTALPSNSMTKTQTRSASSSLIGSSSRTQSESDVGTSSNSVSESQSPYPVCSMNLYTDVTNQPARYLVAGSLPNSTVTDLWTGLMWEQSVSSSAMTWSSAETYCSSLSKGSYSDWRLPTVTELQSIVDYTVGNPGPTIDATLFPNTPVNQTWTSVPNAADAEYYWDVEFSYGQISSDLGSNAKAVRCLRGSSLSVPNRYTDENGYGLTNQSTQVRDVLTGLTWERTSSVSNMSWSAAQSYCQGLTLGAAAWRLPTIKELTSLVDFTAYSPAINSTAFPIPTSNFFWTSTPCIGASGNGWIANFQYGLVNYDNTAGDTNRARCVRDSVWALEAYADATNQPNRYVIVGNGTEAVVTDTYTGLMWEQVGPSNGMTWSNATAYCAGLVKNNFGCWRLPTGLESQGLIDYTVSNPSVDSTVFSGALSGDFWFSPLVITTGSYKVRCVRGNNAYPATRYTDENGSILTIQNPLVKDQATELIWQRGEATRSLPWDSIAIFSSAQGHCANIVIGNKGAGSWCLPNIKQLISIVDYTIVFPGPTINATVFPFTGRNGYWASTPYVRFLNMAWNVYFANGGLSHTPVSSNYNVRCILNTSAPANNGMWSPIAYEDATNQTARYQVSGTSPNAIVTDDFTGLMWEQQVSGSTYTWNASAPAGSAQAYCAGLTKGGYADWRLPTPQELQSLADYTLSSPSINTNAFPGGPASTLLTSTIAAFDRTKIWDIRFDNYACIYNDTVIGSTARSLRCVRGPMQNLSSSFTATNGNFLTPLDVQVQNNVTGLIWQRHRSGATMHWSAASATSSAQAYCQNLVVAEYGAGCWRLPTAKELTTLVDYTAYNPSINATVFPGTNPNAFWTSTPRSGSLSQAWFVYFRLGLVSFSDSIVGVGNINGNCYARCILNTSASSNNGIWSPLAYQDATNQIARYYVSGSAPNAIVTDDLTGLMWEQQVSPSTYFWNASAPAGSAQAYCAGLTKGGYKDWRLPTPQELQSLVDYTLTSSFPINTLAFFEPAARYWTSLPYASDTSKVWDIRFSGSGIIYNDGDISTTAYNVRCVRRLNFTARTRYTDENGAFLSVNSTQVRDQINGLIWQRAQAPLGSAYTWDMTASPGSAQAYCSTLTLGNQTWRLPTIKELTSLVDYNTYLPGINRTAFPGTASNAFWSSTALAASSAYAWVVNFNYGLVYYNDINVCVRCVRP